MRAFIVRVGAKRSMNTSDLKHFTHYYLLTVQIIKLPHHLIPPRIDLFFTKCAQLLFKTRIYLLNPTQYIVSHNMCLYFIAWGVKTTQKSNTQSIHKSNGLFNVQLRCMLLVFHVTFQFILFPIHRYIYRTNIRHNITEKRTQTETCGPFSTAFFLADIWRNFDNFVID